MSEVKIEKVEKKKVSKKKQKKWVGVDTLPEDVIKWGKSYDLHFEDDKDTFLELPTEVLSTFDAVTKQRYAMAKAIARGEDVIGEAVNGQRGFSVDYDVMPGSASEKLAIFGGDPKMSYHWSTPAKLEKHLAQGAVIDHDPNVKTRTKQSGAAKTVGGQRREEMVLVATPKEVVEKNKQRRKELRDRHVQRNKDTLHETFDRAGIKLTDL